MHIGAMTTRAWSLADRPYGSNIGAADFWSPAGAGYGLPTRASRVTTRSPDAFNGTLVFDPSVPDSHNGPPAAWSHVPLTGQTSCLADEVQFGGPGQSIAMARGRHRFSSQAADLAGRRRNRWSGAYAAKSKVGSKMAQCNSMFIVDWSRDVGGGIYRGCPAPSTDAMLGLRYRILPWIASTGLTCPGKAGTDDPTEVDRSDTARGNTVGLACGFDLAPRELRVYGQAGMVTCGLSPLSMSGKPAFTHVDSRLPRHGRWSGVGAVCIL